MENTRNAKTRTAVRWLGQVLGNYVQGDWDHDQTADELDAAIFDGLDDDFGPVVRQLDTLRALRCFADALTREVAEQARHSRERGATWEQIAAATGCNSKQAAQARYSA
jgi:hypothetical protein